MAPSDFKASFSAGFAAFRAILLGLSATRSVPYPSFYFHSSRVGFGHCDPLERYGSIAIAKFNRALYAAGVLDEQRCSAKSYVDIDEGRSKRGL
jgi:hypothetical protein